MNVYRDCKATPVHDEISGAFIGLDCECGHRMTNTTRSYVAKTRRYRCLNCNRVCLISKKDWLR